MNDELKIEREQFSKRRAAKQRLKKRAAERIQRERITLTPREIGKAAKTPKPCSCSMCGNPRRYTKKGTLQERRKSDDHYNELE